MFDWFNRKTAWESPVGDPEQIDMIGERLDGGVDLMIVVCRPLDQSQETADVFGRKVRNYCQSVASTDFAGEFGPPSEPRVCIAVRSDREVPEALILLVSRIGAEECVPAKLAIQYESPPARRHGRSPK